MLISICTASVQDLSRVEGPGTLPVGGTRSVLIYRRMLTAQGLRHMVSQGLDF